MLQRLLIAILLVLAAFRSEAQFSHFQRQEYTLSHLIVEDTIWAATENGVFKMLRDGQVLWRFTATGTSFPLELPTDMCLDAQGRLLVCTELGRIVRFEHNGQWSLLVDDQTPVIGGYAPRAITTDGQGILWAFSGIFTGEIFWFDGQNWHLLDEDFNYVRNMKTGPDGALYFIQAQDEWRMLRLENGVWQNSIDFSGQSYLRDFCWDTTGNLFALTENASNHYSEIWKFNGGDITSSPEFVDSISCLGIEACTRIAVQHDGKIWIGGYPPEPFLRFDGTDWEAFDNQNSFRGFGNKVEKITVDANGAVWFSGDAFRLLRFQDNEWSAFNTSFSGMSSAGAVDSAGNVWFAGAYGLGKYEPGTSDFDHFFPPIPGLPTTGFAFNDIKLAADGSFWGASGQHGLWHFDGQNWENFTFENTGGGLPSNDLYNVEQDAEGNIWVISVDPNTFSHSLSKFSPSLNQWTTADQPNDPNFPSWDLRDLEAAPDTSLWIAEGSGLIRVKNGVFTIFNPQTTPNFPLINGSALVFDVRVAPDGKVWFFIFENGLASFDGVDFQLFTPDNSGLFATGLPYSGFEIAADNSIWVSFTEGPNAFPVLQKFNGSAWQNFDFENSELPPFQINLIVPAPDGSVWFHDQQDFYLYKTYPRWLRGQIRRDENSDCLPETSELPLNQWLVRAEDADGQTFFGKSNSVGNYEINLDSGIFDLKLLPPTEMWSDCDATEVVDLTTTVADTVNFSGEALADCPLLDLDLSVPFLRRCFDNDYRVSWCNLGTAPATDAFVKLKLPDELVFQSMSVPFSNVAPGMYNVPIGDVAVGQCGSFRMTVLTDCDVPLGQTLCVSASIFPDTFCLVLPDWSGADLTAKAECANDTVNFTIKNHGNGAMANALEYLIIEDEVIMLTAPIQLPPGDSVRVPFPISSGFQRIQVPQEVGHPFPGIVNAAVESCNGQPSEGFLLRYFSDDASPFHVRACEEVIGSFDPNDKAGSPFGTAGAHFIFPGTSLEYKIRFQNTGTDTAFTVVVRDTLSPFLDVSTLRVGSASHPFEWGISGGGILTFRFDDILLPDSFVNEPASHGFLSFSIRPFDALPLPTLIENRAGIFFDFNEAIITNTVFHTLDTGFLQNNSPTNGLAEKIAVPEVSVFPNPAGEWAFISLKNKELHDFQKLKLRLRDPFGRLVLMKKFNGKGTEIRRGGLADGVYFWEVSDENEVVVAVGKLVFK